MRNPATYDCECNKACTSDKYPEINKCSCEKCLFGKLVLSWPDEIISATETSLDDKKSNMLKN